MRSDDKDNTSVHCTCSEHPGSACSNCPPNGPSLLMTAKHDGFKRRYQLGPRPEEIDYSGFSLPQESTLLPTDYDGRKGIPVCTGVLDYFPAALIEVARVSKAGNDQHNPGEELHWARGKSMDQADTMLRHWMERGTIDTDGVRHSAKAAWRALANLQLELEAAGAPLARGARQA